MLNVVATELNSEDAILLMDELSSRLYDITGSDGRKNFRMDEFSGPRSVFLMARSGLEPIGCGALRPISDSICEIKRMYSRHPGKGVGGAMLRALEEYAARFSYEAIWLETRVVNDEAVRFYLANGYQVRENYGPYIGRQDAICFEKMVMPG
ncbi:GNAT family N-acetyltransferase [Chitinivorax sp. B]|uniref:GNAT family N-acetyltransferase n=1 Tax=Chitinivorax sp. B TaxID=2502235 RepID=UPI0010F65580|nr:GNAT family N-acetyltransferase [Chitinivorax sp. B]